MRQQEAFFGAMFESEAEFERYLSTMALPSTWGDELCIRAFADAYQAVVHVVTSTEEHYYLKYDSPPPPTAAVQKHVFLTYISPVHYDSLTLNCETSATC